MSYCKLDPWPLIGGMEDIEEDIVCELCGNACDCAYEGD